MSAVLTLWATILEVVDDTDGSGKGSLRDGFPRKMQLYCGSRAMMDPERKRLEARRSAPFVRGRQPEPAMAHGIR